MKKLLIILSIIMIIIVSKNVKASEEIIIPEASIRLRVVANSNSIEDQYIKSLIKDKIEQVIEKELLKLNTIEEAKKQINNKINSFKVEIDTLLKENNYNIAYNINYGQNYFPEKEYKGIKYKEGYYESLVIIIGDGAGDNWWCVLFPPLCLLETDKTTEIEYKFWVKELIDKII